MPQTGARQDIGWLRFPVERSLGRRYPEQSHPYRNDFQRDRDRIVHARAFRRLENKTQVFAPGLFDHFRNENIASRCFALDRFDHVRRQAHAEKFRAARLLAPARAGRLIALFILDTLSNRRATRLP